MNQITSPPIPSEASGWSLGDANRWVGNILKDQNMSTSSYLLRDSNGKALSLQDLSSGKYKTVLISSNTVHTKSNPAPSYAFTQKSSSRSRQTDNILQGSGLTPAYVRAVVDKEGLHKGTITLTKMLQTPDRRGRPSTQAIDILSSRLYKLPRTNPPSSLNYYVLGSSYEGVSEAVRQVVKDYLLFGGDTVAVGDMQHKIPSYMSSDFALYNQFTQYALAPYVINSMANRKFIHRMSTVVLPKVNMLIDMDEDINDKKKLTLKKKFEDQYEALIHNLATSPTDFYDGKDFAILVDPRFVFPEVARLMLPPPSELRALDRGNDWSVVECMLYQADERNFSRDRIDLPSDMPDVTALFTGRHYEGRKPDSVRHSLKEFYNTSIIDLSTMWKYATAVYDAEQSPFVNRSKRSLSDYNKTFLKHAEMRGFPTDASDRDARLQAIRDGTDTEHNSKSGILNIVDLEGIRPRPVGWPIPVVHGVMNTLAEYYDNTGLWPSVVEYDENSELVSTSTGFDETASVKLDITETTDTKRKRGTTKTHKVGPVVEEGVPLETLLIKTAHYAESKGHKVSSDDIKFAAFMILYGMRQMSALGTGLYSPIVTPIERLTDEIAKGFQTITPEVDVDYIRSQLGIRTNPTPSVVKVKDGDSVTDMPLDDFIVQIANEVKESVKKKVESTGDEPWYKESWETPSLYEVGVGIRSGAESVGKGIGTMASSVRKGIGEGASSAWKSAGTAATTAHDIGSKGLQDVIKVLEETLSVEEMEDFHAMDKIAFRLSQKENEMLKKVMSAFPDSLVKSQIMYTGKVADSLIPKIENYIDALNDMKDVSEHEITQQLKETIKWWEGFLEQLSDDREPKRWLAFFDAFKRARTNHEATSVYDYAPSTPDIFTASDEIIEEFVIKINEVAWDMGLSSKYKLDEDYNNQDIHGSIMIIDPHAGARTGYAKRIVEILTKMKDDGLTKIKREHLESGKYTEGGRRQKKELRPTTQMSKRERKAAGVDSGYLAQDHQLHVAQETEYRIEEKKKIEADKAMKKAEKKMGIGPSRKQRLLSGLGAAKGAISKRVGYGG